MSKNSFFFPVQNEFPQQQLIHILSFHPPTGIEMMQTQHNTNVAPIFVGDGQSGVVAHHPLSGTTANTLPGLQSHLVNGVTPTGSLCAIKSETEVSVDSEATIP